MKIKNLKPIIFIFALQNILYASDINVTTEILGEARAKIPFLFKISITLASSGDGYIFKANKLNLQEGIKELNVRQESSATKDGFNLHFIYELVAEKNGEYFILPTEFKYEKLNQEFSFTTEKVPVTIGKSGQIFVSQATLIILCIFLIFLFFCIVMFIIKRRKFIKT